MVMKSDVKVHASEVVTGKLSMPIYSLGAWELAGGLCSLLCCNDGGSLGSHLQGLIARKL
jgi:hypothetical protein